MGSSTSDGPAERLFTGYTGRLSILLAVSWFVIKVGRSAVPPVLPQITDELSLSPSAAGFAITVMWAVYALMQYPGGRLSDQLTRKTVQVASFLIMIVGFLWLAVVGTYLGFLGGLALVGVGAAFFFTPTRGLVADLFDERRGQAVSIQVAAGRAGSAAAGSVAVAALAVATWRATFLPVIAALIVLVALLHFSSRESYVIKPVGLDMRGTGTRVLQGPRTRLVLIAYVIFATTSQSFTSFLPTLLQADKGFSSAVAGISFSVLFLVGIVASLAAGLIGDRFSRIGVGMGSLALGAVGIGILVVAPSLPLVVAGIVVFAAGIWAFSPVMQAYLMDVFSEESFGGDFGAMKTVYNLVGSLGPTYVGLVAERADYLTAFAGLIVILAVGAAILAWLAVAEHTGRVGA